MVFLWTLAISTNLPETETKQKKMNYDCKKITYVRNEKKLALAKICTLVCYERVNDLQLLSYLLRIEVSLNLN